jgi:hypothetical protein
MYPSGQSRGSGGLATHLRTSQGTRRNHCLLNKSKGGEANKRIIRFKSLQKDLVVATLGRFWHVPRFRCCLTGSLGLRQHRLLSASSNQPHSLPPPLSLVDVARSCYLSSPDHLVPSLLHPQLSSPFFNSPLLIKAHQLTLLHTHLSYTFNMQIFVKTRK